LIIVYLSFDAERIGDKVLSTGDKAEKSENFMLNKLGVIRVQSTAVFRLKAVTPENWSLQTS
jgi:hypothetical protein